MWFPDQAGSGRKHRRFMPDFDKLHDLAERLAKLTKPGERQEGLGSWCQLTGEAWKQVAEMWDGPPDPPATAPPDDGLQEFTVRISGTAPVWADVTVRAEDSREAYRMVNEGEVPNLEELSSDSHEWEFCEGGNGIDDWSVTGDVYDAEGNELMVDGEWQEEEDGKV
jgi:hypothetical protein